MQRSWKWCLTAQGKSGVLKFSQRALYMKCIMREWEAVTDFLLVGRPAGHGHAVGWDNNRNRDEQ